MKIVYGRPVAEAHAGTVVTVGVFDGVHLGHQKLLAEVRRIGAADRLVPTVVVFDRHPATVVRPETAPRLLTSLRHRLGLFESAGIELAYVLRFDEERSLQSPAEFVQDVLVETLGAKVEVAGEDFHFGHRRRGDVALMSEIGAEYELKVVSVPLAWDDGIASAISSSAIRQAVAAPDLTLATRLLGRPHEVHGIVEHGDARGRTIGFPTANVAVAGDILLPPDGVYAGWYVGPDGVERAAAINVGRRPTFYDENGLLLVEAHLIDFDGDLYGQPASVQFVKRLRDEERFSGIDALAAQLRTDVEHARAFLLG